MRDSIAFWRRLALAAALIWGGLTIAGVIPPHDRGGQEEIR